MPSQNPDSLSYLSSHLSHLYQNHDFTFNLKRDYHAANILPHIQNSENLKICEIGPGFGEMLSLLTEKAGVSLTAVDNSEEVIQYVREKFPAVDGHVTDNLSAFFESRPNQFDYVLMIDVLEHLEKKTIIPVLQAIRNALKPAGKIIIQTLNGASPFANNILHSDFTHTWAPSEFSAMEILKTAGFHKIDIRGYRFPNNFVGLLRTLLRIPFQWLHQLGAIVNGNLRMKILDPNLIAVAETK